MEQWFLGLPLGVQGMVVLIGGLPYIALVTGRLVPRQQVQDWRDMYRESEATRREAVEAIKSGAVAMESTRQLVEAVIVPLAERVRRDDAS
jgi:hypothetical protein